jgi:tetratricopeptide (TPR) repeat protein
MDEIFFGKAPIEAMKRTSYPFFRQPSKPLKAAAAEKISLLFSLALREYNAERMDKAEKFCLELLSLDVRHAEALYLLGMVGFKTQRYEVAERMIRRAIAINGRQPYFHSNLGTALGFLGKTEEAITCFERALEIQPDHAEACYNLGNTRLSQNKQEEAIALYKRALAAKPDYADAWCNMGVVYRKQDKTEEALPCFERAVALAPENADLCCNLGDALHNLGRVTEAEVWYKRAVELNPQHHKSCNCLCNANFDLGRLEESLAWCERALALKPDFGDALMNRSLLLLLMGDYANGWRSYEVRWTVYTPRGFTQPLWQGEPLNGRRIVLYAEQGLGDSLQFLRYVPMVQAAGGQVILDVPANLRRLATQIPGLVALVNTGDPFPQFDLRCPLMSLPLAFGTTLENIPARVPYLTPSPEARQTTAALDWPTTGLKVGLAWTGNPKHPKNRYRSVPLELLQNLFDVEGVHFFSLQMGEAAAELAAMKTRVVDLAPVTVDMADTAAQMEHLDLVITIDTSMAHLAGALGRPLWVLLSHTPDWRWLMEREDCPWYPTARLFRQKTPCDWPAVIERVRAELIQLAAQSSPGTREERTNYLPGPLVIEQMASSAGEAQKARGAALV